MSTEREYWKDVRDLAELALEEVEGSDRDLSEIVDEVVEDVNWLIYNNRILNVLRYTNNLDAIEEVYGEIPASRNVWDVLGAIAFFAMRQDVWDEIERMR